MHSGAATFLFCDGAVRFISENVSSRVFGFIRTRDANEAAYSLEQWTFERGEETIVELITS
jgi:prepilin-type processing-associated H-X9-DG protein